MKKIWGLGLLLSIFFSVSAYPAWIPISVGDITTFVWHSNVDDTDGDGLPDSWELSHGFNPGLANDPNQDSDQDGLTDIDEYLAGTNPKNADTDADGLPDAWELQYGFSPINASDASQDFDQDGISNYDEYLAGTNPINSPPVIANRMPAPKTIINSNALIQSAKIGAIEGDLEITPSGGAVYRIPISLPEGTAGVAPEVGLVYSSGAGNGLLGLGWNVAGQSAISRCRQSQGHDLNPSSITWSASDPYCLDGQRLILQSGTHGSQGAIYKTEIDQQKKITIVSLANGIGFKVEGKDGARQYYGDSAASQLEFQGNVLTWTRDKIEDSVGNQVVYTYLNDVNGLRLSKINYAYVNQVSHAEVRFEYSETRPDPLSRYLAGKKLNSLVRLEAINVFNGGENVRDYSIEYITSNYLSNKTSLLNSIEECSGNICLPKTFFNWSLPDTAISSTSDEYAYYTGITGNKKILTRATGDINGDGRNDLIWIAGKMGTSSANIDEQYLFWALANEEGGFDQATGLYISDLDTISPFQLKPLDYNADGRIDVAINFNGQWKIAIAQPYSVDGWGYSTSSIIETNLSGAVSGVTGIEKTFFGDVDSDGLVDAVVVRKDVNNHKLDFYLRKLKKDPSQNLSSNHFYYFDPEEYLLYSYVFNNAPGLFFDWDLVGGTPDFNGDGIVDLAFQYNYQFQCNGGWDICVPDVGMAAIVFDLNGNSSLYGEWEDYANFQLAKLGDFNNDGLTDIYMNHSSPSTNYEYFNSIYINNGNGFNERKDLASSLLTRGAYTNSDNQTLDKNGVLSVIDYNKDGYQDLVTYNDWGGTPTIEVIPWDPQTENFSTVSHHLKTLSSTDTKNTSNQFMVADFAGDGLFDVVKLSPEKVVVYPGTGEPVQNLITDITNGLNQTISIQFKSLIAGDVYTRYQVGTQQETVVWEGFEYTKNTLQIDEFYEAINGNWSVIEGAQTLGKYKPVLEYIGGQQVVSKVSTKLPAGGVSPGNVDQNSVSSTSYQYAQGRIQASGRGLLGFQQVRKIDDQSGLSVLTTYRQDFPFVGMPEKIEQYTAAGNLYASVSNVLKLQGWQDSWPNVITNQGSIALGALNPYLAKSIETRYEVNSDGGQGDVLAVVETLLGNEAIGYLPYDDYGNLLWTQTVTKNAVGDVVKTTTTSNQYGEQIWEKELGRLAASSVTHQRGASTTTRSVEFAYYDVSHTDSECVAEQKYRGLLCKEITEPNNSDFYYSQHYKYDAFGNVREVSAGDGITVRSTRQEYDPTGRYIDKHYNALNQLESRVVTRNNLGLATVIEDINGVKSYQYYDSFGTNYLSYSEVGTSSYTLTSSCAIEDCSAVNGAVYKVVNGDSAATLPTSIEYYDIASRVIRKSELMFDGSYAHVDTEFDSAGRLLRQSEPHMGTPQYWTTTSYDDLSRVKRVVAPDDSELNQEYVGLSIKIMNDLGQTKTETVNELGEIQQVEDGIGSILNYEYDPMGNLVKTIQLGNGDVAANTTQICYDLLGRKYAMRDPDKGGSQAGVSAACPSYGSTSAIGWWFYEYNVFDELVHQTDTKKQTIAMDYDATGRLTSKITRFQNGSIESNIVWEYDTASNGLGELSYVEDTISNYKEYYTYDNHSRQHQTISTHDPASGEIFVTETYYDEFNRPYIHLDALDVITSLSGTIAKYNQFGFYESTKDLASGIIVQEVKETNVRNQVTKKVLGNGLTEQASYYAVTGLLDVQTVNLAGVFNIQNNKYIWDTLGNLKSRHNTGKLHANAGQKNLLETFEYDAANRLEKSTLSDGSVTSIRYDSLGNITYKSDVGNYLYNRVGVGGNTLTSTTDGVDYHYDSNGNLTSDTNGRTLTYGVHNKPISIVANNHNTRFKYGPSLSRYERTDAGADGVITKTQYIGNVEKISRSDSNNVEWKRYIGDVAVYTTTTNANDQVISSTQHYLHKDHLGSVDIITNASGDVIQSLSFDAWGQRRNAIDWHALNLNDLVGFDHNITTQGFTSHEMLDEVGLVHMNGRIYDPRLGRFLQADPYVNDIYQPQSYNRYSYVLNNPLNSLDPSGYFVWNVWYAIAWAVASYLAGQLAIELDMPWIATVVQVIGCINGYCQFSTFGTNYAITGDAGYSLSRAGFSIDVMALGSGGTMADTGGISLNSLWTSFEDSKVFREKINSTNEEKSNNEIQILTTLSTASDITAGKFVNGAGTKAFSDAFHAKNLIEKDPPKDNTLNTVVDLALEVIPGGALYKCGRDGCDALDWVAAGVDLIPGIGKLGKLVKLRKLKGWFKRGCSFVAGTLVATAVGAVPIEDINPGDYVLSKDEVTGEVAERRVNHVFVEQHESVTSLVIENNVGEEEVIITTAEHPFYVDQLGWLPAGALQQGDNIETIYGEVVTVKGIEEIYEAQPAYNFEVDEFHTYAVGDDGLWVHNVCDVTKGARSHSEKVKDFHENPSDWTRKSAQGRSTPSGQHEGGANIESVWENNKTGERVYTHEAYNPKTGVEVHKNTTKSPNLPDGGSVRPYPKWED